MPSHVSSWLETSSHACVRDLKPRPTEAPPSPRGPFKDAQSLPLLNTASAGTTLARHPEAGYPEAQGEKKKTNQEEKSHFYASCQQFDARYNMLKPIELFRHSHPYTTTPCNHTQGTAGTAGTAPSSFRLPSKKLRAVKRKKPIQETAEVVDEPWVAELFGPEPSAPTAPEALHGGVS